MQQQKHMKPKCAASIAPMLHRAAKDTGTWAINAWQSMTWLGFDLPSTDVDEQGQRVRDEVCYRNHRTAPNVFGVIVLQEAVQNPLVGV